MPEVREDVQRGLAAGDLVGSGRDFGAIGRLQLISQRQEVARAMDVTELGKDKAFVALKRTKGRPRKDCSLRIVRSNRRREERAHSHAIEQEHLSSKIGC